MKGFLVQVPATTNFVVAGTFAFSHVNCHYTMNCLLMPSDAGTNDGTPTTL
ncbi:MAG TPA: hypothetical protein VGB67_10860 [Fibrella sp.]